MLVTSPDFSLIDHGIGWLSAADLKSKIGVAPELGTSVQSALGKVGIQMLEIAKSTGRLPSVEDVVPFFGLVDSRRTFEKALSISASGKFGGSSAHASWSESYSQSRRTVRIAYSKRIVDTHELILQAGWSNAALAFWKEQDPLEFYLRYGDQYISEVLYGGSCTIVLSFSFENEESARAFSGGFSSHGATMGGSISAIYNELRSARQTEISLLGSVRGVRDFPDVDYKLDTRTGYLQNQPVDLGTVGRVLDFFNNFEKLVLRGDEASLIGTSTLPINKLDGAPISRSVVDVNQSYEELIAKLDDEFSSLDRARSDVEYMSTTAYSWNEESARTEAADLATEIKQREVKLNRLGASLSGGNNELLLPDPIRLPPEWFLNVPNVRYHQQSTTIRAHAEISYQFTELEKEIPYVVINLTASSIMTSRLYSSVMRVMLFGLSTGEAPRRELMYDVSEKWEVGSVLRMPFMVVEPAMFSAMVAVADGPGAVLTLEVRY